MLYTRTIMLKTATPLYHFKYGEIDECVDGKEIKQVNFNHQLSLISKEGLRATEVKPRFITYLKYQAFSDGIFSTMSYGDLTKMIALIIDNSMLKIEENSKLETGELIEKENKVLCQKKKYLKRNFFLVGKVKVELQVKTSEQPLVDKIEKFFKLFILSNSFGRRKYKGYGSFILLDSNVHYQCNILSNREEVALEIPIDLSIYEIEEKIKYLKKKRNIRKLTGTLGEGVGEYNYIHYIKTLLGSAGWKTFKRIENGKEVQLFREGKFGLKVINPPYRLKFFSEKKAMLFISKNLRSHLKQYREYALDKRSFDRAVDFICNNNLKGRKNASGNENYYATNLYLIIMDAIIEQANFYVEEK